MRFSLSLGACLAGLLLGAAGRAHAQPNTAPFDLTGPRIEMRVTRGNQTLPIAAVPNLQPGDKVWVHAEMPSSQAAHYLLVVAFLRGATNPPPEDWFLKEATWQKKADEGMHFTVPPDAQQTLLFLAPETGGDFRTLRNAVRGRPGSFVRASQDLNQVSLDRSRLQSYINSVRETSETNPTDLEPTSKLLARSLVVKVNQDCFERPTTEQEQCLTQNSDSLVLNDGHSQSTVAALTTGAGNDLVKDLAYTPTAGGGYYSAYVGAIFDVARLLEGLHTAEYQYIPALTSAKDDNLELKLNNPPSFHNPKSVIVVALPPVQTAKLPPLHAIDTKQVSCLQGPSVVLPVEGAPLVYSTGYAHSLSLHVEGKSGHGIDLPVRPMAAKGGMVVDASAVAQAKLEPRVVGKIVGMWGFERLDGPSFNLNVPHPTTWTLDKADANSLVVGRDDEVRLHGDGAACVAEIQLRDARGKETRADFHMVKPDELQVKVPMTAAASGDAGLLIRQRGLESPDQVAIQAYAQAGHLDALHFHAGDNTASLVGTRLDEVAAVDMDEVRFKPGTLTHAGDKDTLTLQAVDAKAAEALPVNLHATAHVLLKDGRTLELQNTVSGHRPQVLLASRGIDGDPDSANLVHLIDPNELPVGSKVKFVLKTGAQPGFTRADKVDIASEDQTLHASLDISNGLVLQDATTMLGTFDPLKLFGPSAFGRLQLRAVDASGAPGDWVPLGTLVRLPQVASVKCQRATRAGASTAAAAARAATAPEAPETSEGHGPAPEVDAATPPPANDPNAQCTLNGSSLFLIDSIASDPQFTHSVSVPDGYTNPTLAVPRPATGELYLRLRDDPTVANTIVVPPSAATVSRSAPVADPARSHPAESSALTR